MARYSKSRKRNTAHFVSDVFLNVAAAGGFICIVLVGLAFTMNITLIMFKTGSMSPTIPAGSVALVQEIPASELAVGDVVTVDRDGKLPVTHRVTSVEPTGSGDSRTFTMRGDANPVDDADPYTATKVRIVRGHLPELANVIVWLSNPLLLGAITLGASGLVTWAFWPRKDDSDDTDGTGEIGDREDAGEIGDSEDSDGRPSREGKMANGTKSVALAVVLIASVSVVPLTAAEPAHAAETESQIIGTVLKLTSIADSELMSSLQPGIPVIWQVGVTADAPSPGTVDISLSAAGNSAGAQKLDVSIDSCAVRWTADTCTAERQTLVRPQLLADALIPQASDGTRVLTTMPSAEQRWLRIAVTLNGTVEPGFSETLHVVANGLGNDVSTESETQTLPETGSNLMGPLLLALAALFTGLVMAWLGALWKRRTS